MNKKILKICLLILLVSSTMSSKLEVNDFSLEENELKNSTGKKKIKMDVIKKVKKI